MSKFALLSVYDKAGIVEFAEELVRLGFALVASGGTAKCLEAAGLGVTDVSEITGYPAVLGHRVVTLAPQIHGGLMAAPEQRDELQKLGWPWIDLLCVDLYPLEEAIDEDEATEQSVLEATDIGGPALIRSAAKGRRLVIAQTEDRQTVLDWLNDEATGTACPREEFTRRLAGIAEGVVADYCYVSAEYLSPTEITAEEY